MIADKPDTRTRRYRGPTYVKVIDAANEAVPVIDLADWLAGPGKMRRVGKTWATNCLLPNHEDRTPSFVVYPETNSWHCFGCILGGDAVELYRLVHGFDQRDAHVAAANLLYEFGHEPPQRPPAWFRKQERQAPVRRALEDAKRRRCQRRLYRWLFAPIVARFDDEAERQSEERIAWEEAGTIAQLMASQLRGARP